MSKIGDKSPFLNIFSQIFSKTSYFLQVLASGDFDHQEWKQIKFLKT